LIFVEKVFKENIDKLLQVNLEVNALLQSEKPDSNTDEDGFSAFQFKIEILLTKKDSIINTLKELKEQSESEFTALKGIEYKEIWEKAQELENQNLESMKAFQALLSEGAVGAKMQSKAIFSYKFNKEIKPRLFDDSL